MTSMGAHEGSKLHSSIFGSIFVDVRLVKLSNRGQILKTD